MLHNLPVVIQLQPIDYKQMWNIKNVDLTTSTLEYHHMHFNKKSQQGIPTLKFFHHLAKVSLIKTIRNIDIYSSIKKISVLAKMKTLIPLKTHPIYINI